MRDVKRDVRQDNVMRAIINGVEGIILESTHASLAPVRDYMSNYQEYHIYELRHGDNDWSEPVSMRNYILVNYFGIFITKDDGIFEIDIDEKTSEFNYNDVIYHVFIFFSCKCFDILSMKLSTFTIIE